MKEILLAYLKHTMKYDYIEIKDFHLHGDSCSINYYIEKEHYYSENTIIEIWKLLKFVWMEIKKYKK
jgi:hypothetical protein